MPKSKRSRAPSRVRYEQDHPTVSFRVSKELYDRLQTVKDAEGKSTTDVLKMGVRLLEVKVRKEKEVRDQAYDEGYEKGYEEAASRYEVSYPCEICGKMIVVMSTKQKEAIKRYMLKYGWGHADCVASRY